MAELTLGSLFDGLGGWQLAALHNGVRPVWSSEIEAFPMAVTKKHFPDTLQLGDINRLNGAEIPPVDIICAGSPCQGLSISGKKKGLNDERSGLFRKAIDIVRGMRTATNGEFPKFFIWENVPGAFSTNQRHDFKAVLQEITETEIPIPASGQWATAGMVRSGRCDIAWRVLDAQYWGVPQRRRRIFLASDFRDKEFRNTAVLFEPESVQGDIETSGGPQQKSAIAAESSTRSTGNTINNAAQPLKAQGGANGGGSESYVVDFNLYDMTHADEAMRPIHGDKANTLTSRMGTGGNQVPVFFNVESWWQTKTIRRLTPLETERLQGLPDSWTDIEFNGKPASDSARYKAIGNGMAQPCADFVLSKVVQALRCWKKGSVIND